MAGDPIRDERRVQYRVVARFVSYNIFDSHTGVSHHRQAHAGYPFACLLVEHNTFDIRTGYYLNVPKLHSFIFDDNNSGWIVF